MSYWGYHLIVNAGTCCQSAIRSHSNIHAFAKALVQRIDMVPFGEPQIEHFGSGNKAGFTLVQLIETSNICAHFVEETDDMYLDVFSCKPFKACDVLDVCREYFNPSLMERTFMVRQAPTHGMPIQNGLHLITTELK